MYKINSTTELDLILSILVSGSDAVINLENILIDWDKLYILTLRHKVVEQIYSVLQSINIVPQSFMGKLLVDYNRSKFKMLPIVGETKRVSRAFDKDLLPYIMLKGVLLGDMLYGGSCNRECKDIDVWVDPERFYDARSILYSMGYLQCIPEFELTQHNFEIYSKNNNDITLFHPIRKVQIELHYKQKFFGKMFYDFREVKTDCISLQGVMINYLDNNYHVLYLILHGTKHAWLRVRWLYDVYLFIIAKKCDIEEVYKLSIKLKSCDVFLQSLWLVRCVFNLNDNLFINNLLKSMSYRSILLAKSSIQFICSEHNLLINPQHFGLLGVKNKIIKSLLHL